MDETIAILIIMKEDGTTDAYCSECGQHTEDWYIKECGGCGKDVGAVIVKFDDDDGPAVLSQPDGYSDLPKV